MGKISIPIFLPNFAIFLVVWSRIKFGRKVKSKLTVTSETHNYRNLQRLCNCMSLLDKEKRNSVQERFKNVEDSFRERITCWVFDSIEQEVVQSDQ